MKVKPGFIFFDIETSVKAEEARNGKGAIIQIAAIATDIQLNKLETFERKILFKEDAGDPFILNKVHYNAEVWQKESKAPLEVAKDFIKFCQPYAFLTKENDFQNYQFCICGGHNISDFDLPVLFNWYKKLNTFYNLKLQFPAQYQPCIDTLSMINLYEFRRQKWFTSHKLPNLCETFDIELTNWHEALSDVEASIELAKYLLKEI